MLTMVVFLSPIVAGHEALVSGVRASFDSLPLLSAGMDRPLLDTLVGLMQSSTALAIRLAAPMLMTMLVVDLALGCIGRAMPQMNVMAMGLSLRAVIGTIVLIVGLGLTDRVIRDVLLDSSGTMQVKWMAPGGE
jgi:flagellar biosynthetic protein FliR